MEKLLLSLAGAFAGFLLSQSFNFVSYLRRPKFAVSNYTDGVASSYTGDPPETPWEIELGFYLQNRGKNPALKTRIFVSEVRASTNADGNMELTTIELLELKRPIDFIPAGECVLVPLGKITGNTAYLSLYLNDSLEEDRIHLIEADTRGCIRFSAKFYVTCEDKNSSRSFTLHFRPDTNEWASAFLEDYTPELLGQITRPSPS